MNIQDFLTYLFDAFAFGHAALVLLDLGNCLAGKLLDITCSISPTATTPTTVQFKQLLLMNIIIDKDFKSLMVPLTSEEFNQLEKNVLDWGCKDKLTVWSASGSDDTLVLLDGHNRYAICTKHSVPFEVEQIELETRDAAIDWIINYQLGRRNITSEQQSYLRGVQYEREKSKVTNPNGKNQHAEVEAQSEHQPKTAEKLAEQHKVGRETIKRDAQYARAVNAVDKAAGNGAKTALLSCDTKVSKQDAVKLGANAESSPQAAINVLEQIEQTKNSKEASRIICQAHKQATEIAKEHRIIPYKEGFPELFPTVQLSASGAESKPLAFEPPTVADPWLTEVEPTTQQVDLILRFNLGMDPWLTEVEPTTQPCCCDTSQKG